MASKHIYGLYIFLVLGPDWKRTPIIFIYNFIYLFITVEMGQQHCLIFWVLFDHMTFCDFKPGTTSKV